jgi:hypothetical protein
MKHKDNSFPSSTDETLQSSEESINSDLLRPPLDFDKFIGKFPDFQPQAKQYASNKVSFGLWNFTLKSNSEGEIAATFSGVYRNGFMAFMEHYGFYKKLRKDNSYFFLRCVDNKIEEIDPVNKSDFVVAHLK